jgi:hypothetical protein
MEMLGAMPPTGIASTSRSMSGYQRLKRDYSVFTGFWYGSRGAFVV